MVAASVSVSKAQPYSYYVVGDFNGWVNPNATAMTDNGPIGINGSEQYSYQITGQTPSSMPPNGIKVTDGTWANTWPNGNNMELFYDSSGDATIYFYPGTISDGWSPLNNRVGYADTGAAWEVTGDFGPGWGTTPNLMTLDASQTGVYTNIYVVATPGTYNMQFRTPGTWSDVHFGATFDNGSGNAVFTTTSPNQAVLIQLDLPNGRWQAGGPPAYCNVTFSVDMTLVALNPGFDPTSVTVNGSGLPNGWGGTPCNNTLDNPNIFTSAPQAILAGADIQYQFRCNINGSTAYDALGGVSGVNRTLTVPNTPSDILPTVFWDDASPDDVLLTDTAVTFSVNMNGAVGTDSVVFGPGDYAMVNGLFGWLAWNPDTLSSYILNETPVGSGIYTLTETFSAGSLRAVTYKYSINGADDEAGFAQNHFRYIRSSGGDAYTMPVDTFGNQYVEPKVGGLVIGTPSGGSIPVSWLPYPNVKLQTSSDLMSWTDVGGTTYPQPSDTLPCSISVNMGGSPQYFRLVQPAP